jgi:hypothetical protein
MQDEHEIYLGSGRELRNTLHLVSLWVILVRDDDVFRGGPFPPYIVWGVMLQI